MRRSLLRFLRVVCPASHVLIEVTPGLDGPVLLLKSAAIDKARPAPRLADVAALGRDAVIRCQCACAYHDVPVLWITARLGAGVARVVWDPPRPE